LRLADNNHHPTITAHDHIDLQCSFLFDVQKLKKKQCPSELLVYSNSLLPLVTVGSSPNRAAAAAPRNGYQKQMILANIAHSDKNDLQPPTKSDLQPPTKSDLQAPTRMIYSLQQKHVSKRFSLPQKLYTFSFFLPLMDCFASLVFLARVWGFLQVFFVHFLLYCWCSEIRYGLFAMAVVGDRFISETDVFCKKFMGG
jgi:hypothetical protein